MLRNLTATTLLLLLSASCATGAGAPPGIPWPGAGDWAKAPLWDDGLAEVATYDARRRTYGQERVYEATILTVKETFTTERWVKAESAPPAGRALEVLKQNQIERWGTQNYPYTVMTSVFVDRADAARLVKLTMGHQEWCGNTFKEWKGFESPPTLVAHSYWEPDGDSTTTFAPGTTDEPLLLLDQLPLSLRSLPFADGFERAARVLPTLVSSKTGEPRAARATIRVSGSETVACGLGSVECWRVEVALAEGGALPSRLWFGKAAPNVLVRYAFADREGTITRLRRWAYWDRSKPDPLDAADPASGPRD